MHISILKRLHGYCILRHPTADFAEQNGRNAKLIGHRPLPL